ncbi:ferritin-like domain-containing protein [Pelagibius litoralis]|uniref:Ferritin-like domain-containing protein n=1 Tax=Pelagibius litoralis TaxID=374515 RepID=A0A967EX88_9PROT|nr:ferritin-like domain-containing protein [Pelagibius litoralis]NIA68285.1 ferritin-like domain-containing protein [Pelagibius litoralis]
MAVSHWNLDDIPWQAFDRTKVDPELVKIIKAASLVEYNGGIYADYLCNVFPDDAAFQSAAKLWAREEVQHGAALAKWASLADESFDFDASFQRFRDGYQITVDAPQSVRGSRSGELVARCIVEVGTSSYYASIASIAEEPVLKAICRNIAADELRHYKLFYTHLKRYLEHEQIGRWRRLAVAVSRVGESEDDELAYAFYAANEHQRPYCRKLHGRAYMKRAYACYQLGHVRRAVSMTFKAAGLNPQNPVTGPLSRLLFGFMQLRSRWTAAGA